MARVPSPFDSESLHDERGMQLIEFIGVVILIVMVALIIWQFMAFAHASMIANSAAQEGARAAAVYEPVDPAVERSSPGYDRRVESTGCGGKGTIVTVRVSLRVPVTWIPFIDLPDIWTLGTARAWCEDNAG
jgi:hypothetical protein